ncbi:histone H4 transcription factor [Pieris brassicae]|uniref:histone H4 transcription factor n=1 Tax=Pieris brassicae TaxID=7116 RepID=UPI001E6625D1|nr:histone H4 transcription factor [Pieris brassicae]XP_045513712.1 histone H4 transcription factor [Pieris brassicae]
MDETIVKPLNTKDKISRCIDWLKEQNNPKKLSLQNKNDIQFIIETNAHRKKFFLTAEDDATVPVGVGEVELEPRNVPVQKLRHERLCLECEWPSCREFFSNYVMFQAHVRMHISDVHITKMDGNVFYHCLWDVCGHKSTDRDQIIRHINYHAYHAKLLAIGLNARATLKLERCKKDSTKRNQLPPLLGDHCCMWYGCTQFFDSIQDFLDHVQTHIASCSRGQVICSWAGCGAVFVERAQLSRHMRAHTSERLIACYHCGTHFALNRKLSDHLMRQNVDPSAGHKCSICGEFFASDYLLREHVRRHVSCYACSLCDMSQPTPADLAHHVRYRHMASEDVRRHACPDCDYKAVTKYDLRAHIKIHNRKRKKSSDSDSDCEVKKQKNTRKYICHICPDNKPTIFARGTYLTMHLVKVHGAQWPCGHSRFRYQKSEDGMFRLTTTRFEVLEVSKKIVDGCRGPNATLSNKYEFNIRKVADCTATAPTRYEISIINGLRRTDNQDETIKKIYKEEQKTRSDIGRKDSKKEEKPKKKTVGRKRTKKEKQPIVKKSERKEVLKKEVIEDKEILIEQETESKAQLEVNQLLKNVTLGIHTEDLEDDISAENIINEYNEVAKHEPEDYDSSSEENTKIYMKGMNKENECEVKQQIEEPFSNALEIEMCDVDEQGNVLNTEVVRSKIIYSYVK